MDQGLLPTSPSSLVSPLQARRSPTDCRLSHLATLESTVTWDPYECKNNSCVGYIFMLLMLSSHPYLCCEISSAGYVHENEARVSI